MSFPLQVRLEVQSRANYTCCWCRIPGQLLEVHHIEPEAQGGPNTIENAAPLCPNCHTTYGHNPQFRTQMRQRRDDWNRRCDNLFAGMDSRLRSELDEVQSRLVALEQSNTLTPADVGAALTKYTRLLPASAVTDSDRAMTGAVLSATANVAATYSAFMSDFIQVHQRPAVRVRAWATDDDGTRRLHIANEGDDILELDVGIPDGANLLLAEDQLPLRKLRNGATAFFAAAWASNGSRSVDIVVKGTTAGGLEVREEETLQLP